MKVLHIITTLTQGGAESTLFRLTTNKHNSILITHIVISMLDLGVYGKQLEDSNIEVHKLEMKQGRLSLKGVYKLWLLIHKIQPDVVQTWMYHSDLIGGIVSRLAGCRNVVWSILNFNVSPSAIGRTTRWVAQLCGMLSDIVPVKITSCSERAVIEHQKIGYSQDKFITIPLGYDLEEFKRNNTARNELRYVWDIGTEEIVIGCVARWDRQKDHANLLHALFIIKDKFPMVKCVLAGPGMDASNHELIDLVKKINGDSRQIVLAGRVESIPDVMSAIDLHILPSLGEAFPNVVAEAMACETPCIVTDVGDAAAIVNSTGWVVPPGNSIALADAIILALNEIENKEAWMQRTAECRTRILENYSMNRMVQAYENLWQSLLFKKISK